MFIIPQFEMTTERYESSPLRINIHLWFVKCFLQPHFYWLCRRTWLGRESPSGWEAGGVKCCPVHSNCSVGTTHSTELSEREEGPACQAAPGSSEQTEVTTASIWPVVSNCYLWNNKATKGFKSIYSSHVFSVSEQLGTFLGLAMRKEYWKNC